MSKRAWGPPGYRKAVERMQVAADEWLSAFFRSSASADRVLVFADIEAEAARRAGMPATARVGVIAGLGDVLSLWPLNEHARELVRVMDAASDQKGTYMQARAVLDVLAPKYDRDPLQRRFFFLDAGQVQ